MVMFAFVSVSLSDAAHDGARRRRKLDTRKLIRGLSSSTGKRSTFTPPEIEFRFEVGHRMIDKFVTFVVLQTSLIKSFYSQDIYSNFARWAFDPRTSVTNQLLYDIQIPPPLGDSKIHHSLP